MNTLGWILSVLVAAFLLVVVAVLLAVIVRRGWPAFLELYRALRAEGYNPVVALLGIVCIALFGTEAK